MFDVSSLLLSRSVLLPLLVVVSSYCYVLLCVIIVIMLIICIVCIISIVMQAN